MDEAKLNTLIKKDMYQVFILTSFCSIPVNFAQHTWFVINKKGIISRWEVLFRLLRKNDMSKTGWGHLYTNFSPTTQGIEIVPFWAKFHWKTKLAQVIEGNENSVAQKMSDIIEQSPKNYPYSHQYSLIGANSNTYIQWALNQFPELNIQLAWNAFGKNYKK